MQIVNISGKHNLTVMAPLDDYASSSPYGVGNSRVQYGLDEAYKLFTRGYINVK